MKLYNSKHNQIEVFQSLIPGEVSMYVCGPTVYNHPHIGNARPIVVFDLLRRVLEASGYHVTMVSNFTDIDDKIIAKAQAEGVSETDIATRYIDAYNDVRKNLNATGIHATPYATQSMDSMVAFIKDLCDLGFAYAVNGDVYFRVDRIKDYGEISSQNIDALQVGARIESNEEKENPLDFALWKKTDDQGIKWPSPWGMGRPGWHTECVVMIQDEFKTSLIDIHGGGQDLKFPHHENESAQCKAVHNHDLANYWVHNAMLNLDGAKMSKSLGNVMWAKDYISALGGNLTRWLLLSTHYRLVLNLTEDVVEQSRKELEKIQNVYHRLVVERMRARIAVDFDINETYYAPFLESLQDDLNVANALVSLHELLKDANQGLRVKERDYNHLASLERTLEMMFEVLGIVVEKPTVREEDLQTFELWEIAKREKAFERADMYRNQLVERGLL